MLRVDLRNNSLGKCPREPPGVVCEEERGGEQRREMRRE